jgi:hypothetical protein
MANPAKAFLAALDSASAPDRVADALSRHLAGLRLDALPDAAHQVWRELGVSLKADPKQPLPARAVAAVASWPKERVTKLIEIVRRLDEILDRLENERLEDEVRDSIRHHYL